MIRTQRFCYHILARKKAAIESHIENRADLGKFCLCFSFASLLSGSLFVLVSQMCPEVFMTVFVSASEKDFYCSCREIGILLAPSI